MIPLFEYFDYQKYLHDYYQEKKRGNPCISFRFLGNRLHLDPGFLLKVIQGKHHLAEKSIPHLCEYLKFSPREKEYFEMLVRYNKAKTASEIKLYFEKLLQLQCSRAKPVQEFQYAYYQKWYHSVIHALLSIHVFAGNYKELASLLSPAIRVPEARSSIKLLLKLGIVKQNEDGSYAPVQAFLTSGEKWHSVAINTYQQESIRLSREAVDRCPRETRDISTVTVAVASRDLPEIRERIRQLRQAILALENEHKADVVFQINIQAFPVTKVIKDET
jgi:uncharacterized protein (TIGR02147 family)